MDQIIYNFITEHYDIIIYAVLGFFVWKFTKTLGNITDNPELIKKLQTMSENPEMKKHIAELAEVRNKMIRDKEQGLPVSDADLEKLNQIANSMNPGIEETEKDKFLT